MPTRSHVGNHQHLCSQCHHHRGSQRFWNHLQTPSLVLLSTACPTSLASDQTKGGGRPGVQRTPRFGAREQRFDLTKIQLSSKLSPKDPKEFAKKFRDATGEPREKRLLQITNLKATLQRPHRLYIYHTEKRSGRATPEIFLFFVCPLRGQFH